MRDGEEGAAQRIEVRDGRRLTVNGGFVRSHALWVSQPRLATALFIPGGQVICVRQPREESFHILIRLRIGGAVSIQDGVVDVVGRLLPWIEDDLFPGVVGVQRGDYALERDHRKAPG